MKNYTIQFLSTEEQHVFQGIFEHLQSDFGFQKSSDLMQVELTSNYYVKLVQAQASGDWETVERIDRMIRGHLKDLKATKITRPEIEDAGIGTTPGEWATEILERVQDLDEEST